MATYTVTVRRLLKHYSWLLLTSRTGHRDLPEHDPATPARLLLVRATSIYDDVMIAN
jgi:hypothetical protein